MIAGTTETNRTEDQCYGKNFQVILEVPANNSKINSY